MTFHPDNKLPDCMMPDGGECCAGYAALHEDWHRQRSEIRHLLEELATLHKQLMEKL